MNRYSGLRWSHADVRDKTKWRGTNWMGKELMAVRDEIVGFCDLVTIHYLYWLVSR